MKIAIALNEADFNACVPDTLEEAAGLLIVESDDDSITDFIEKRSEWIEALENYECEMLLCGDMYDGPLFESIAQLGVTRHNAKGLDAMTALKDSLDDKLPFIVDYVGGPGCGDHD